MKTKQGFVGIAALIAVIVAIIVGGAYVIIKQKAQAPVSNFSFTPPATTSAPTASVEEIFKNIILARMADAQKVASPQDILNVVRKYNVQSSVDEMQSDLPDILSSSEEEKALFISLYKATAFDPQTIRFISVNNADSDYPTVDFTAGSQNQEGAAFFRKENGLWRISMLAVKPPPKP